MCDALFTELKMILYDIHSGEKFAFGLLNIWITLCVMVT